MPQRTVFIRDADIPKWNLIEKKSQWVHDALNSEQGVTRSLEQKLDKTKQDVVSKIVKNADLKTSKVVQVKYCRHGNRLGHCLDKGADRRCRE